MEGIHSALISLPRYPKFWRVDTGFHDSGYYYWFLPLAMALYFFALRGKRDQRVVLLVAMSYLFFWMASGWHFLLLAVSTCTDWIAGRRISDSD